MLLLDAHARRVLFSPPYGVLMDDIDTTQPVPVPAEKIAEHLRANRGNKSKTVRTLADEGFPIALKNLSARIDANPELREIRNEVIDEILDTAEDNVFDDVLAKDGGASRFVLTTLGKDRGWVTRTENDNKKPIEVVLRDLSKEDAEQQP